MVTLRYSKRLISRIIIECATPLSLRSGEKSITTDAVVAKDVNGLPFIPATSIAGVLRHLVHGTESELLFGKSGDIDGEGSKIIFSDALMLGPDGKALDGLTDIDYTTEFYYNYAHLPIRQHVSINSRGSAKDSGKFDNEIVYAGTRFCFEIELVTNDTDDISKAKAIISKLYKRSFRIGGGTRNGYGALKIVSCKIKEYDFTETKQLHLYLEKPNTLSSEFDGEEFHYETEHDDVYYSFSLEPDDFFMFGSGHGDNEVDSTPIVEDMVVWQDNHGKFVKDCTLIPASSIKGAISHRLAFNFNKLTGRYADLYETEAKDADKNEAVLALMGSVEENTHMRGALIFSDIIIPRHLPVCGFNHIKVDSFTSAAINGALFNEKAFFKDVTSFQTVIQLDMDGFEQNLSKINNQLNKDRIIEALEMTFSELCNGLLPLGGLTNKGFGRFTGTWKKE